jgi:curved DNA-binding protein CbpA
MSSASFNSRANNLADFIEHANATLFLQQDDQVFLAPHISRNKLYGAMASYIPSDVNPDEVLLLIDDTVFGSAKEGLGVTNKAIYLKEAFEQPRQFLLKDIKSIAHGSQMMGSSLHINGLKVTSMTQPNAKTLQVFAQLINDYLQSCKESDNPFYQHKALTQKLTTLYPLIDILCHYALGQHRDLSHAQYQTLYDLLQELFETESELDALQKRLRLSLNQRPPLDKAIEQFCKLHATDQQAKALLLEYVLVVLIDNGMDLRTMLQQLQPLGQQLGLNSQAFSNIMDQVLKSGFEDQQQRQQYQQDQHKERHQRERQNQQQDQQQQGQHQQEQQQHSHSGSYSSPRNPQHPDVVWACSILDVSALSTTKISIQQAYRLKVREFHPDKYQNLPESVQQILNEKTQEVNRAKDILMAYYGA